jgi:ribose transport system substrate-binding protein
MLQNPYGQGYIGSFAMNKLRSGCKVNQNAPFKSTALTNQFIDSGTAFVGRDKVDTYIGAMEAVTKDLMASFESTYLVCN